MSITNGASHGVDVIVQAYFQTQPYLTVTMLGFLKSAEMIGRVLGGVGFQLLAGALGQVMPYRFAAALIGLATFCSVFVLIIRPAAQNRPVYEAVRKEEMLTE